MQDCFRSDTRNLEVSEFRWRSVWNTAVIAALFRFGALGKWGGRQSVAVIFLFLVLPKRSASP